MHTHRPAKSEFLGLNMPSYGDAADVMKLNENSIVIDKALRTMLKEVTKQGNNILITDNAYPEITVSNPNNTLIRVNVNGEVISIPALESLQLSFSAEQNINLTCLSDFNVSYFKLNAAGGGGGYIKPDDGIPATDMEEAVQNALEAAETAVQPAELNEHTSDTNIHVTADEKASWNAKYAKPSSGIPMNDLSQEVQDAIAAGGSEAYVKPEDGIPSSDMTEDVQTSLENADTAVQPSEMSDAISTAVSGKYTMPTDGIPSSDMTEDVQDLLALAGSAAQIENLSYITPQMFGCAGDGKTDDTENFQTAIDSLLDENKNKIFVIPEGTYAVNGWIKFEDLKNTIIICKGIIIPIDGVTPGIGTVKFFDCENCQIYNFTMDGNLEGITSQTGYGSEELIAMQNCKNMYFNGLTITNAHQTCVGGAKNKNVIFENTYFENVGEHGFYFDSDGLENIAVNNLIVKDFGTNASNRTRQIAVFKTRFHDTRSALAKNISINNFKVTDSLTSSASPAPAAGTYRLLIQALDTEQFSVKNGTINGNYCCVYSSNAVLDRGDIENITFRGKTISMAMSFIYGDNYQTAIPDSEISNHKVTYRNCSLENTGTENAFFDSSYENCIITVGTYIDDNYGRAEKAYVKGCTFKYPTSARRIDIHKATEVTFEDCTFIAVATNTTFILCRHDMDVNLINCKDDYEIAAQAIVKAESYTDTSTQTTVYYSINVYMQRCDFKSFPSHVNNFAYIDGIWRYGYILGSSNAQTIYFHNVYRKSGTTHKMYRCDYMKKSQRVWTTSAAAVNMNFGTSGAFFPVIIDPSWVRVTATGNTEDDGGLTVTVSETNIVTVTRVNQVDETLNVEIEMPSWFIAS